MLAAGLVARKARERGLKSKPWVKTSLAPGSKVVMEYYEQAGLVEDLEALGFHLVGFGCTTCIGNSGPLPQEVSDVVNAEDLAVVSVLSGNRNFEGRINPDVKMNYLASPPLVVAYALAGTMDIDLLDQPLGEGSDGEDVYLKDIWPTTAGGRGPRRGAPCTRRCSRSPTARSSRATSAGAASRSRRATASPGPRTPRTCGGPRSWRTSRRSRPRRGTSRARACSPSSVTRSRPTTSPRPARSSRTRPRASTCRSTASRRRTSTPTARAAATTR